MSLKKVVPSTVAVIAGVTMAQRVGNNAMEMPKRVDSAELESYVETKEEI